MSPQYHLTEPHPTVPKSHLMYSGRGGAGNITHVNPADITSGPNAQGPASRIDLRAAPQSPYYAAGRGGAGNFYREKERAIFSFDEELERQRRLTEHQAPVYHVGRGGAGNAYSGFADRQGSASSSAGSTASGRRSLEGVMGKIRGSLSRHS